MAGFETVGADFPDEESLAILRARTGENCMPSDESVEALINAELAILCGQFVAAGKSTIAQSLETEGWINIPSWTNRDLRPGEVEGVDKITCTLATMAQKAVAGEFLELEQVRPGFFYATEAAYTPGARHLKDVDVNGLRKLRSHAPELPAVIPLPPLRYDATKQVSEWERRVVMREALHADISPKAFKDLEARLVTAIRETDLVLEEDLINNPNTLVIVNDDLPFVIGTIRKFLDTQDKPQPTGIYEHLLSMRRMASTALDALVA